MLVHLWRVLFFNICIWFYYLQKFENIWIWFKIKFNTMSKPVQNPQNTRKLVIFWLILQNHVVLPFLVYFWRNNEVSLVQSFLFPRFWSTIFDILVEISSNLFIRRLLSNSRDKFDGKLLEKSQKFEVLWKMTSKSVNIDKK